MSIKVQEQSKYKSIEYFHSQAVAEHKKKNYAKAISFYLQSIELDKKQPEWVYGNAISLLAKVKRFENSLEIADQALEIYSDSDKIYRAIGFASDQKGDILSGINHYRQAIKLNPAQPSWVYFYLTEHLINQNFLDEALQIGQQGAELNPESHWSHYYFGEALAANQEWEAAIAAYIRCLEIKSDFSDAFEKLDYALEHRHLKLSKTNENSLIKDKYNSNNQSLKNEGIKLLNQKKLSEAKLVFEEALKDNSDDVEIYSYLTQITIELKDVSSAEFMMQKMLDVESSNKSENNASIDTNNLIGITKIQALSQVKPGENLQDKFEAHDYFGVLKAIEKSERQGDSIVLHDIRFAADSAFRMKSYSKAAKYYSEYLENRECSWCRHHLGQCLVKLGKPMDAIPQFLEELKVIPESFWAYHQIREIQYKSGHFDLARAIVKNYFNQSNQNIEKIINRGYRPTDNYHRQQKILPPFLGEMGFEIRHFLGNVENWLNKGWKILAKRPDFYPPGTAIYDELFFKALKKILSKYAPYGVISLGFGYYIPPQKTIRKGGHLDSSLAPIDTLAADTQTLYIAINLERELRSLFAPFLLENKDRPLTIWDQKLLSCTNSVNATNEWTSFDRYIRYSIPTSYKPYYFENPTHTVGSHIGVQLRNISQKKYEPVQRNSDVYQALKQCEQLSEYYDLPVIVYGHPNGTYQPEGYEKTSDNIPVDKLLEKELGYLRSCKIMLAPNSGWSDLMAWLQVPTLIENNITFDYFSLLEDFSPVIGLIDPSISITKQADHLLSTQKTSKVSLPPDIASAKDISYSDKLEFIIYG